MSSPGSTLSPLEVDVATTVAALNDPNVQIIDCREQNEWDAAHAENMTLMPLDTIGQRLGELDPSRPLIIVCRSGRRSLLAAQQLAGAGFGDVKSMQGGLIAWAEQGHALVSNQP
ncbi:MAG: rhodanese-like domain-containing protein [Thermomicrobiales bacterium]|nr:MAG: rhodanese-like domain-containing protein [Thermomicrobiales bacterium]